MPTMEDSHHIQCLAPSVSCKTTMLSNQEKVTKNIGRYILVTLYIELNCATRRKCSLNVHNLEDSQWCRGEILPPSLCPFSFRSWKFEVLELLLINTSGILNGPTHASPLQFHPEKQLQLLKQRRRYFSDLHPHCLFSSFKPISLLVGFTNGSMAPC